MKSSILFYALIFLSSIKLVVPFENHPNCAREQIYCKNNKKCIPFKWACDGYKDCTDNSDEINCYYPNCAREQTYCKNNKRCIPYKWACDGYKDCTDNSDEINCLRKGLRIEDLPGVRQSKNKALSWLRKQRKSDWGWGRDTNRAIVTLRLSEEVDLNTTNVTNQLMFKQLKLQLSQTLLTNDIKDIKTYEIASYVNSLLAVCSNPKNFEEFDLVDLLEVRIEESESINPAIALAICNSNQTIRPKEMKKLEEVFLLKKDSPHRIDSQAYALMAFSCLKTRTKQFPSLRKYKFMDFNETIKNLSKLQNKDGSFGNIYTTAVLLHALLSIEQHGNKEGEWNVTQAINYLLSHQKQDGSFGDGLSTYLILPILNGKTFVNLGSLNCSMNRPHNLTIKEEIDSRRTGKHRVNYYIIVGENKDIIFSLFLNVPINSTFFEIMQLAEELDDKFRFKSIDYPWGKYIYSIFGIVNHPEEMNYWQLFKASDISTPLKQWTGETPKWLDLQSVPCALLLNINEKQILRKEKENATANVNKKTAKKSSTVVAETTTSGKKRSAKNEVESTKLGKKVESKKNGSLICKLHPLAVDIRNKINTSTNNFQINWVRSHQGTEGNERADALAKEAALDPNNQYIYDKISQSTLKHLLWEEAIGKWQTRWNEMNQHITYRFISDLEQFLKISRFTPDHYTTQFLSFHGDFASYLARFTDHVSEHGPTCTVRDGATHYLYGCTITASERTELCILLNEIHTDWPCDIKDIWKTTEIFRTFKKLAKKLS
ncbi:uncharacterized protein [Centruroides vittatus]|uniref:uncharacterized protein n=1 Tax=Centruroides vittatus TaxID=120091 RepID=UPI00350EFD9D